MWEVDQAGISQGMYIHRIVIDANRINTTLRLPGMNGLEAYHAAGLVELLASSTLQADLKGPIRQEKARQYQIVGSTYIANSGFPGQYDVWIGAPVRFEDRESQMRRIIFGEISAGNSGLSAQSRRDVLHIHQAWQNDVDFFVTDENRLLNASNDLREAGFDIDICRDNECLDRIQRYFFDHFGTSDVDQLEAKVKDVGPVLLGNKDCFNAQISDLAYNESEILALWIDDGVLNLRAALHDAHGHLSLRISPNEPTRCGVGEEGSIRCAGSGPIRIGQTLCASFVVHIGEDCVLAARALSSKRVLFHRAILRGASGNPLVQINKEFSQISGIVITNSH